MKIEVFDFADLDKLIVQANYEKEKIKEFIENKKNKKDEEKRFEMTKKDRIKTFYEHLKLGKIDPQLVSFLDSFNSELKNYYTASSCAGRIMLIAIPPKVEKSKKHSYFVMRWHRTVKTEEILNHLEEYEDKEKILWLKQEPFIFHFVAKNIYYAQGILEFAKKRMNIKRGGIFSLKDGRIMVEILHTPHLSVPVKIYDGGWKKISKTYLKEILKIANLQLEENYKKLEEFFSIKEFLKDWENQKGEENVR